MIWKTKISLEEIRAKTENTLMEYLGIEFFSIGDDYLCARMLITNKVRQPMGILHGGASCALAESVGSMAASFCVNSDVVGLSLNTNHVRALKAGIIYAKAQPLHLGRSTQVWTIAITDETERLVATSLLTMAVLSL
jgi:uncharacterized protein (TIGR00369 family)